MSTRIQSLTLRTVAVSKHAIMVIGLQAGSQSNTHEQCWYEMQGCQPRLLLLPRRKLNRAPVGRALSGRGRRVMKRS